MSEFRTAPRAHQAEALRLMRDQPTFALMMGVGTGKSWLIINDIRQQDADVAVVFAPNGVHSITWRDEQFPEHWSGGPIEIAATRAGRPAYGLHDLLHSTAPVRVACVNYEALDSAMGLKAVATLMRQGRRVYLACDESHRLKTPKGKRTRALWKLAQLAQVRRILSGTMLTRGYEDYYAQYRFLDWRIIGAPTYTDFKNTYCQMTLGHAKGNAYTFQTFKKDRAGNVLYQNVPQLLQRISPVTYQVLKQYADLPPVTHVTRPVPLSDAQRQLYTALTTEFIAETERGLIVEADQVLTRILRLQQVICGHISVRGEAWEPVSCPRLEACAETVAQSDGKVLVWARFIPDRVQLLRTFAEAGVGALEYSEDNLRRFRTDPGIKALIMNPASNQSMGLTLNEAPNAVHYSRSFRWVDLEQSEGRNHRDGQTVPVTYVTLRAPGTVDDHITRVLASRQNVVDAVHSAGELRRWFRP